MASARSGKSRSLKADRAKKAVIHYDMENTGSWSALNPKQKSEVTSYCRKYFLSIVEPYDCDSIPADYAAGDNSIAYFNDEDKCIQAGLALLNAVPEIIRRSPYIKHVCINPRIIAFLDTVSGDSPGAYSGKNIEEIIPNERKLGKAGAFRIIGDDLWDQLDVNIKYNFTKLDDIGAGKYGKKYNIYEAKQKHNADLIRKRHLPPYLPYYQEQLYKFYSNMLAARNGLTINAIKHVSDVGSFFTKKQFTKEVLEWCRAYLEMTVSARIPKEGPDDWIFKLSFWARDNKNVLKIVDFAYPEGMRCLSHEKGITLKPGENIVGRCFAEKTVVVSRTDSVQYVPLHDKRNSKIVAVAAFPLSNPINNDIIGVLCADTRVEGYFSVKQEETNYHTELISSFTHNLVLAQNLPD